FRRYTTAALAERRCGNQKHKKYCARRDNGCAEMNGAHIDQWIAQDYGPRLRIRGLLTDTEGEASFRLMRIDRKHMPAHPIGALRQRLQSYSHCVAVDLRLALIDAGAVGICHFDGAERRFDILRERQGYLALRACNRAADKRIGALQDSVSKCGNVAERCQ